MTKEEFLKHFKHFSNPKSTGIEKLFTLIEKDEEGKEITDEKEIKERSLLFKLIIDSEKVGKPINKVQLNQVFIMSGLHGFTYGFFKYYWLELQPNHPYNLEKLQLGKSEPYMEENLTEIYSVDIQEGGRSAKTTNIISKEQLRWGFLRLYTDTLLYFGNVTLGYNYLSSMKEKEIKYFFLKKRLDTETIKNRGHSLDFNEIDEKNRYLISEMACKNFDDTYANGDSLEKFLLERFEEFSKVGDVPAWVEDLLDKEYKPQQGESKKRYEKFLREKKKLEDDSILQDEIKVIEGKMKEIVGSRNISTDKLLSASKLIEENAIYNSKDEISQNIFTVRKTFLEARELALKNTKLYLSLVDDLDVYVATSMRTKNDFMEMADVCKQIFGKKIINEKETNPLAEFNLRFFDPTMSAASGHDDKGLIECLMVKCAKVLIYTSGDKDSYGKDSEAAMALSSGKPVIFFCDDETRKNFFLNVHPLTKLIDFKTGVANGAIVLGKDLTKEQMKEDKQNEILLSKKSKKEIADQRELEKKSNIDVAIRLLKRIFTNDMQYALVKEDDCTFKLKELSTDSTIRIQTSDLLLEKVFWNYFDRHVNNRNKE